MGNERHVCLLGREVSRSTFLGLACRSHSSCFTPFLTPVPLRVTTEGSREEWVGSEGETLEAPFLPPGGRLSLASHVSPHSASVPLPVRPA